MAVLGEFLKRLAIRNYRGGKIIEEEIAVRDDVGARHAWYHENGWWSGEPVIERYARIAAANPEALAVLDDRGIRFTHAELWQQSGELAEALAGRGVVPGDVVLIFMPNRAEWQLGLLAILRVGAIPANLPVRTDAATLNYVLQLCQARAVLGCEHHGATATGEITQAAVAACGHAVETALFDDAGSLRWVDQSAGFKARPTPERPQIANLDHIMFTSSTTGMPKAVMHSADTLAALHKTFIERFNLKPARAIFMASPLGHSVGAIHGVRLCLYSGMPLVLLDRWDVQQALTLVEQHDCQFTAAATPFLKDLIDAPWDGPRPKLAAMGSFLCGGAQVPASMMEAANVQFPHTFTTVLWGMTEGGLTTCVPDTPRKNLLSSAGKGLPGLELQILDDRGEVLPAGEQGELTMRGPGVFIGYFGQDDLYQSLLTPTGFFRTGDLARLDDAGYVRITGRLKDLIIRGGVNISPVPVEDALAAHPDIHSVAVIGYPDERLGERLCAVLVMVENAVAPTVNDLQSFLTAQGLPKYLCPELVRIVDDMPRTAAGKIRKLDLKAHVLDI